MILATEHYLVLLSIIYEKCHLVVTRKNVTVQIRMIRMINFSPLALFSKQNILNILV